jgi:RNA-binding protein YhbY
MSFKTATVIQAIKAIGKSNIDNGVIKRISKLLSDEEKQQLLQESKPTTSWVYQTIKKICGRD